VNYTERELGKQVGLPAGSALISILLFSVILFAFFSLALYPVLRNTTIQSRFIAMANRTTRHNPLALARRTLSELELEAITGEPSEVGTPTTLTQGQHVRDFAHALSTDTVGLISGSGGVALAFLAAYFAFVSQHNIAILWLLSVLCISFAAYRVWVKERRALIAEQTKNAKPEIGGEIEEVHDKWVLPAYRDAEKVSDTSLEYFFTIKARIYNVRPVPTTLRFELWLQAPNANFRANRSSLSGLHLRREEHATGTLSRTARMQTATEELTDLEKLGRTPLALGSEHEGWLRFVIPKANSAYKKDVESLCLVARDVYGGTHIIQSDRSEWYHSGEIITEFEVELEEQRLKDLDRRLSDKAYGG
jgi:hypothetical protein